MSTVTIYTYRVERNSTSVVCVAVFATAYDLRVYIITIYYAHYIYIYVNHRLPTKEGTSGGGLFARLFPVGG